MEDRGICFRFPAENIFSTANLSPSAGILFYIETECETTHDRLVPRFGTFGALPPVLHILYYIAVS
jgi:hypothetical protein